MNRQQYIITGNKGFVGVNLSNYLTNLNGDILGVSRKPSATEIGYQSLTTEILNTCSAFIHLAGKAHDLKKTSEDAEYFQVNTELTKILFDVFLKSECEVFIYMSSVKAVADQVEGFLAENETPNPITAYGKSKLAAENYILSKEIPKGKRVFILRPCMIHGPNNKGNLNVLYSFVSKGIPYPFGKYKNKRSFVSVDNLCFIIHELITNKKIQSGVFNIADDASLSTTALVKIIGETIKKPAKILNIPKPLVIALAKIGDILPLPVNSEKLEKLTENYQVSNLKIKQALQKELPLSTSEGLKKTIASF
ncbi:NAD-dependent epimerase/dehydratase family protein [Polaribacter sp. WD7]|uniref:NAD-dependent epimerase/dehydratase family protein n=1 Tax=Polaribacter sp. WD7 TaxID=2269061 RepID=UPI000DF2A188|nr:NAD-dependent epimerase/dehydratase family protein [Polaribacter sp. WD7]RCS27690.1 NAD-dependent epimerase/dehydratase family protein [Polaribacter sp. WD7]